MKKLTYYIFRGSGQDQNTYILNDQQIVERYRRIAKNNNDTDKMAKSAEEIKKQIHEPYFVEINGKLIKQKRIDLGLSQVKVATACGVSINTYRYWEQSATTPNKENIMKLREVLMLMSFDKDKM